MAQINEYFKNKYDGDQSELREKINRPVVVISRNGDIYKGTGRSIPGVDLYEMLDKYRDRFISFGGHSAACGFTIDASIMDQLRKDLNSDIRMMLKEKPDLLNEVHTSDAVLEADDVDLGLAEALQMMEPCGKDNEVPVFVIRNAEVRGWRFLKDDDKMARFLLVTAEGRSIDSVIFRNAAEAYEAVTEGRVDIYCNIEINTWRDVRKAQVIAREILPAGTE